MEAPSFVVPYLIEKCAKDEMKRLLERLEPPRAKGAGDESSERDSSDSDDKADGARSPPHRPRSAPAPPAPPAPPEPSQKATEADRRAKEDDDYFDGAIGRFLLDIGLSLVQEHVQGDLLRVQKRKVSRGSKISDPSLSVSALTKGNRTIDRQRGNCTDCVPFEQASR